MAKEGILGGITKMEIAGIPIGAAAAGAAVAGIADGLIGLIPAKVPNVAARLVGALALAKWGGKTFIGEDASQVAALLLTYDAVQETVNLRGVLSGLFTKIGSTLRTGVAGGLGDIDVVLEEQTPPAMLGLGESNRTTLV